MANEKILNTRIQLKYDSYKNWVEKNPTLLSGEVAIAYLPPRPEAEHTNPAPAAVASATLIKVGPGQFNALPWLSATAADVYSWAKQTALPIERAANDGETAGNVISGISWDESGKIVYTTASVATSEGMTSLQEAVDAIEKDIADNRADWAEKTVDTNTDTQYRFTTDGDKLVVYKTLYTLGVAGAEEQVGEYEFLTAAEVAKTLEAYYTSEQVDALVKDKLHTQAEIEGYIDAALAEVSNTDTIEGITTLVEYVNTHGSDLAAITKEIYGDSGKVGDDPSRIDTAIANAAAAVETANTASGVANTASNVANEAKGLAEEAKEAAVTAQNSASASASAASVSAEAAAASATLAGEKADAASASAEAAAQSETNAGEAKDAAVIAQGAAESARDEATQAKTDAEAAKAAANTSAGEAATAKQGAEDAKAAAAESARLAGISETNAANSASAAALAQSGAEAAQIAAEQAKNDAEAAKIAAEASNTSATAIANAAKSEAEAATLASNAATEAVAGLHKIATSGDLYDSANVGTAKNANNEDVPCFIFYCGTASGLV